MHSLSAAELDELTLSELVTRMDEFLVTAHRERYPGHSGFQIRSSVSDLVSSRLVSRADPIHQRRIAHLCFAFLAQMEMNSVALGIGNQVIYDSAFNENSWRLPTLRLGHAALWQYQVVGTRIAFEVFIDLLHVVETGDRLETRKSKLGAFRRWLKSSDNRFHYFAHILLEAYRFDRQVRTPEVHGTSRLPKQMLTLVAPSSDEQNAKLRLGNVLLSVWAPLIEILNERRPTGMTVFDDDLTWFNAFTSQDDDLIESKLAEMLDQVQ
jgi:hypothetical protein